MEEEGLTQRRKGVELLFVGIAYCISYAGLSVSALSVSTTRIV